MSLQIDMTVAKSSTRHKVLKPIPKIINIGETYFGNAYKEGKQFKLTSTFLDSYKGKKPNFGFNGLGEFVFYRTYSRTKPDGTKETFLDVVTRVVEGTYEIQRRHCTQLHIPWDYEKAQDSAQEMFVRMWNFKFLPPGRGLWMMGTDFMYARGSAALNNCGMISTDMHRHTDPAEPYCFMMDMSMLGVGIGFDTRGAGQVEIVKPNESRYVEYEVHDSREGWVDSLRALIHSYNKKANNGELIFNYDKIRPAGSDINGFGGKASGSAILEELHAYFKHHLNNLTKRVNKTLSSSDIVDLQNYIGKCVVAGNVRRTSQIAFGESNDAEYARLKNPKADLPDDLKQMISAAENIAFGRANATSTVPAIAIEDIYKMDTYHFLAEYSDSELFQQKNDQLAHAIRQFNALCNHRWASNNSVFAEVGQNYDMQAANIVANGEPGFLWLENCRNYGRMIDGYKPGIDGEVVGSNPCFSGNMRLFTGSGYVSMYDLWVAGGMQEYDGLTENPVAKYGSLKVINNNGVSEATKVYKTGDNVDLYRVTMSDNSYVEATENHEFIMIRRSAGKKTSYLEHRVRLRDLEVGHKIPINQTSYFGVFHDPAYAELAGWCIGDGSLSPKKDGQIRAECTCYDEDATTVLPKLSGLLHELYAAHNKSTNQKPAYVGWLRDQECFDHIEERVGSNVLGRLLSDDGVKPGDKHHIPNSIWAGTRETVAAFIRGLASADGYVHLSDNGTIGVRINQSNKTLLGEVRLLLNQFGISSAVYQRRDERISLLNDGKGGKKEYKSKANFELIVSGIKQAKAFLDQIGFVQNEKMVEARKWLAAHLGSNNSNTGRYVSITKIEYIGKGDTYCLTEPTTNQVVVEGYQVGQCAEQSLEDSELCCLAETFPVLHSDDTDYKRTLKFAFLYAKTVTLLPTHSPRTNAVMLRNRRIGLSQSGIVQAFSKFGRRATLTKYCDEGYDVITDWDKVYSRWLCIPQSIKKTSVKPSGTVSLLTGCTPGIHYPEAQHYWRRVRINKDSPLVKICEDAGYHVEPAMSDPNGTAVIKFAVSDNRVKPTSEISIWEQVTNAVDYQRYYVDNQVSVTIKFKPEEAKDIARVLEVYEDQLKSISFLPHQNHGYVQAPYEPCTEQEVLEYNAKLKDLDFAAFCGVEEGSKFCDGDSCAI